MEPDISGPIFAPRPVAHMAPVESIDTAVDLDEDLTSNAEDELDVEEPLEFNREAPVDPDITSAPEIELGDEMEIEPHLQAAKAGGEELSKVEVAALDALSEELALDGGSDADGDGKSLFDSSGSDLSGDDPEAS